jgi:hypothetical protein
MPTRWDVAVHEASHAVVAHEFRKPVNRVSVVAEGVSLGHTNISNLNDWDGIDLGDGMNRAANRKYNHRRRRTLAIYVAGDVGNNIESGSVLVSGRLPAYVLQDLAANQHAASAALHHMADLTAALMPAIELADEASVELLNGEERARRILRRRWQKVRRLAAKVFARGTVQGQELDAALCR